MFSPAYKIVTPRLTLRCYNPKDAPLLEKSVQESLDNLLPWLPWAKGEPEELEAKVQRLRQFRADFDLNSNFTYGIFDPTESRLVGGTGLHPRLAGNALEIGYWIHKDLQGVGYASEAASALVKVAFEIHKVERVEIHCAVNNIPSAMVPQKLGFIHEANLMRRGYFNGEAVDSMIWTLFSSDYPHTPSARIQVTAYDAAERIIL